MGAVWEGRRSWDWRRLRAASAREARRLVRDPHDADEVAQEAMARAWRARARCRQGDNPLPWVLQITRMEAFRLLERRRVRRGREVEEGELSEPASAQAPGDEEIVSGLALATAVARLHREERALLYARYVLDLTQEAAAELLGMPEGTAKVRLHRIRLRLRKALEETA